MTTSIYANDYKLKKKLETLFNKELNDKENLQFKLIIRDYLSKDIRIKKLKEDITNKNNKLKRLKELAKEI